MKHTLIRAVPDEAAPAAFSGCSHGPTPAARRAATAPPIFVNGATISEPAIAQEAQNHRAASGAEARAAAARALVIRELLLQRARAVGLEATPAYDAQGREETAEEALVRQVLELEAPGAAPSAGECRRLYDASSARFKSPDLYEASHILFAPEDECAAAWDAARERAVAAIESLAAGADFAACARSLSACPSGAESGRLGQLSPGDLAPELEQALLNLTPGAVGPVPVRTKHGWHVIRLEHRAPAKALPFEAVAPLIADALRARASVAAAARYVERLASAATIEGITLSFGAPS